MSLICERPRPLPSDRSRRDQILFTSQADGTVQVVDLYTPSQPGQEPLPLVLAPHPITWTAAEEYHGGYEGYRLGYHRGWYGLADKYGVAIAMPHGHHRRVVNCSLASPEQIGDMAQIISEIAERGTHVDLQRVYLCGKSMGGQEALVAAGCHPDLFAAVVAFNPIVDLAAWYQDLAGIDVEEIQAFRPDELIVDEVGGLPQDVPDAYDERSAMRYAGALSQMPCLIFWSEEDLVVPRQTTHHAYRLYAMVKDLSASSPIAEYNHTRIHGRLDLGIETRWQLHEWCDYELALNWMLVHSRPF